MPVYIRGENQQGPKLVQFSGVVDLILTNRADTASEKFKHLGVTAGHVLLNTVERQLCTKKPKSKEELHRMTSINPAVNSMVLEDQMLGRMVVLGNLTATKMGKYCCYGRINGPLDCLADIAVFEIPPGTIKKYSHHIPPHNSNNFKSNLSTPLFLKPEVKGAEICGILRIRGSDYGFPSLRSHLKKGVCVVIGDTRGRIEDLCPLEEPTDMIADAIYFTITTERR